MFTKNITDSSKAPLIQVMGGDFSNDESFVCFARLLSTVMVEQ